MMLRKYKYGTIILLICVCLFSCQYNDKKEYSNLKEDNHPIESKGNLIKFGQFISKFKLLTYPFIANTDCFEPDTALSVPLDMDNDSIFIGFVGPAVTVGMLSDTANFYAVIYCTAAACYMPQLAVYSKNGKLISKQEISKGCGAGEGYICTETLTVNSIHDIVVINAQEHFKNDSSGKEISGTRTKTIVTYKYFITDKGEINVITSK